jgi:hypothetical protein
MASVTPDLPTSADTTATPSSPTTRVGAMRGIVPQLSVLAVAAIAAQDVLGVLHPLDLFTMGSSKGDHKRGTPK